MHSKQINIDLVYVVINQGRGVTETITTKDSWKYHGNAWLV